MEEETEFVARWITVAPSGRYMMFDDEEDVNDWDGPVLEVAIPITMAAMFDSINTAWYGFQEYCAKIFEAAQALVEGDTPIYDEVKMDGDQRKIDEQFLHIVNGMEGGAGEDGKD